MGKIKRFIGDAIISFVYWTLALTPYMVFVVRTTLEQYLAWVLMQAVLVPPLGGVFLVMIRRLKRVN